MAHLSRSSLIRLCIRCLPYVPLVIRLFKRFYILDAPEVEPLDVPPPTRRRDGERPSLLGLLLHVRSRYPHLDEGRAGHLIQEALTAQAGKVCNGGLVERVLSRIHEVVERYISALERVIRELMSRPTDIICTNTNLFKSTTSPRQLSSSGALGQMLITQIMATWQLNRIFEDFRTI